MSRPLDKSIDLLINQLALASGHWLVIADENWPQTAWPSIYANDQRAITIVSNRFDIAKDAECANLDSQFNDFDFSAFKPASFDGLLYRVSKERACSHHIINQAAKLLKPNAKLLLAGEKNDGIKSYVKQASKIFDAPVNADKQGKTYIASIQLNCAENEPLNDKN